MYFSDFDKTLVLKIWAWLFAFAGFIVYFFFGISILLLPVAFCCLLMAILIFGIASLSSGGLGRLIYLGSNSELSVDQKLAPELDKIRHHYRRGDYPKAKKLIRQVLNVSPEHGETLIWKAKVVLAVDGDINVARSILRSVLQGDQNKKEIKSWAETLLKECDSYK